MKETAGYFYLQDPVGALVYIFEKSDEQSGRLRWRLDRNGNRLAYQYEEEADNLPEIGYDGDGSEGNRILYIVAVQAGSEWVTTVGEIVWGEGEQEVGRSVSIKEIGGLLAWVMDPKENVTGFTWDVPATIPAESAPSSTPRATGSGTPTLRRTRRSPTP